MKKKYAIYVVFDIPNKQIIERILGYTKADLSLSKTPILVYFQKIKQYRYFFFRCKENDIFIGNLVSAIDLPRYPKKINEKT